MDGGLQRAADVQSAVQTPGATGQEPSLIRGLLRHRTTATTRTAQACSQTDSSRKQEGRFDAGVCTLGFSIIPAYRKACDSLLSQVRNGGEIIVSDVQLTSGWRALINPLVVFWSREYGGSFAGNRNTRRLFKQLEQELSAVRKQEFFLGSYCYCIGRK